MTIHDNGSGWLRVDHRYSRRGRLFKHPEIEDTTFDASIVQIELTIESNLFLLITSFEVQEDTFAFEACSLSSVKFFPFQFEHELAISLFCFDPRFLIIRSKWWWTFESFSSPPSKLDRERWSWSSCVRLHTIPIAFGPKGEKETTITIINDQRNNKRAWLVQLAWWWWWTWRRWKHSQHSTVNLDELEHTNTHFIEFRWEGEQVQ